MMNRFLVIFLSAGLLMPSIAGAREGISLEEALAKAETEKIYEKEEWLNLLHYNKGRSVVDKKSPFFLSYFGYKNPKDEMMETIKAFYEDSIDDDNHAVCQFPARYQFIMGDVPFRKFECGDYEKFKKKVPMDKVKLAFASENNTVPTSVMGHLFIKISGESGGKVREHAFSYFATDVDVESLDFYKNVLLSSIDGMYILSPYKEKRDEYLYKEQRSVWEVELKLTNEQKSFLHKHMWELKDKNVRYSFIFHNCGTAAINLLKVVYLDLDEKVYKIFETPVDYVNMLDKQGLVVEAEVVPSPEYEEKMARSNYTIEEVEKRKSIADAKPSSQIYLGYRNFNKSSYEMELMPLYQDFYDVSKSYFDDLETKIMAVNLVYDDKLYVNRIDLLKMRSIIDGEAAKYFRAAFENALGEDDFNIKPVVEGGIGYAESWMSNRLKPYVLPKVGYRYDDYNNFYFSPEVGVVMRPADDVKVIISYEKYFDSKGNNRGFDEKAGSSFAYLLSKNNTLYLKYNRYSGTPSSNDDEFLAGVGFGF